MALIEELDRETLDRVKVQDPVLKASYSIFEDENGTKFLYIRTFGSVNREMPDKPSQQLQFGPEVIAQLKRILEEV